MTNAEARFNKSLRPRKPEGSLGRTAQDGHLDSHTAPELQMIMMMMMMMMMMLMMMMMMMMMMIAFIQRYSPLSSRLTAQCAWGYNIVYTLYLHEPGYMNSTHTVPAHNVPTNGTYTVPKHSINTNL